ncbi:MAG: hypothetical protein AAFY71_04405 [Bacteroidota bacterium]
MKKAIFIILIGGVSIPLFAQQHPLEEIFVACLETPSLKDFVIRDEKNKICLEVIFTNHKISGNQYINWRSQEIELVSKQAPETLDPCYGSIEEIKVKKKRATLVLWFGENMKGKFKLNKAGKDWYTRSLLTTRYKPEGDMVMVERTINRYRRNP